MQLRVSKLLHFYIIVRVVRVLNISVVSKLGRPRWITFCSAQGIRPSELRSPHCEDLATRDPNSPRKEVGLTMRPLQPQAVMPSFRCRQLSQNEERLHLVCLIGPIAHSRVSRAQARTNSRQEEAAAVRQSLVLCIDI